MLSLGSVAGSLRAMEARRQAVPILHACRNDERRRVAALDQAFGATRQKFFRSRVDLPHFAIDVIGRWGRTLRPL